mmetsp:Transcript_62002/g.162503  ORF Transcript_62002/g.162503 Transcript_62002/m.162503 type:complete len:96 (+) Transcript_62002:3-290(+)
MPERQDMIDHDSRQFFERLCPSMEGLPGDLCVICLDNCAEREPCRVLHCRHAFHVRCLDEWWLVQRSRRSLPCPTCRACQDPSPTRTLLDVMDGM